MPRPRPPARDLAPRALLAAVALSLAASALPAQEAEVVGTLHTVWRDPIRGGAPRRLFTLTDDKGRATPVELTEAQVAPYGGFEALRLRRVRVAVQDGRATAVREVQARTDLQLAGLFTGAPRVMRYVTLLCRFPDFPDVNPGSPADAEVNFGLAFPGTGHYWDEVSDGRLTLQGSVVRGWYMMPQPRSVYVPGDFANLTAVGRDCAAAADADVDFSQFDGVNFVFNTNLDCCSYGGTGALALDGAARSYAMTWLSSSVFRNLGTISHEIGHSLGLSHSSGSYGLVYDSRWDVMSAADWVPVPGTDKTVGVHVNAYGKRQLGFIPAERDCLAGPGTHEILLERTARPAENGHPLIVRIPTPRFGPTQYYTLEARGIGGYDAPLPGAGVVIHRVGGGGATPSNVIDPDGDFDPSDEGALLTPGEQFVDRENGITVRVIERVGDAFRVRLDVAVHPQVTVASPQRLYSVTAGADSVIADSALVSLVGMPDGTGWAARKFMSGPLSLTTAAGTGDGTLRWALRTTGLAPGLYDQDLRVDAGTVWTSVRVRLVVQEPPVLTLGVYAPVVRDSIIAGGTRTRYNSVAISGTGADTVTWTVTTSAPWITMVQDAGTGPGLFQYTRATAGLAPGMHVALLELRAPGTSLAPLTLIDSTEVLEPLAWRVVARGPARTTLGQGAMPVLDSMRVELDGRHGTSTQWYASQGLGQYYVSPEYPGPVGSAWVRFRRAPRDLAPGTYPATIRFYLASDPSRELVVEDTLVVTAAPVGITLSTAVTRDSVRGITSLSEDSVFVQPTGPASSTRTWRAMNTRALLAFPPSGGGSIPNQRTGPGWIRFIRNIADRAPGWHLDTIDFLEVNGSVVLAKLVDSLYVAPGPVPTTVAILGPPRRAELRAGGAATLEDSVQVTAHGDEAPQVAWTASTSAAWITLLTPAGTGTAPLRWTRSAAGLAPGWHVDTIRVSAPSAGSHTMVIDSLRAYAALAVTGEPQRPAATMGASFADTLRTTGGPTAPVTWALVDGALPAGLAFDATAARLHGIAEASGTFSITVRAVAGADTAVRALQVVVQEPVLAAEAVIDQLLGGAPLGEDQRRYLDLQGNRNGRVDVGDVRAWRRRQAAALTVAERAAIDSVAGPADRPRRTP